MYRRKGRQSEQQASIKKFLEHHKDPLRRLNLLKRGFEKSQSSKVKEFYTEHASAIFYAFYSSFSILETAIHEKLSKGKGYDPLLRDLIELVLPALEKILVMLPELVHQRWQFNSICLIIRKLLHPENAIKLRKYGIKLLVLWLQALQENAGDACMELFASATPHFPPEKTPMGLPVSSPSPTPSSLSLCDRYGTYSCSSVGTTDSTTPLISPSKSSSGYNLAGAGASREVVCVNVLQPLSLPPTGISDQIMTLELMEFLLLCLTSQVGRLQWDDPANHLRGFAFLFFLFKLFYLACLYKNFRSDAGLYTETPAPKINIPSKKEEGGLQSVQEESSSQESEGEGGPPSTHTQSSTSSSYALHKKHVAKRNTSPYRMSSVIKLEYDLSHPIYTEVKHLILKYVLRWLVPAGRGAEHMPLPSPSLSPTATLHTTFVPSGMELMHEMWFTSRDNVNLLLEICRQGFQMSLTQTPMLKKLIDLYMIWIQSPEKPVFMHPPSSGPTRRGGEAESTTVNLSVPTTTPSQAPGTVLPWEQLSQYEGYKQEDVRAGLQASLRMCIAHTSQVFLGTLESEDLLRHQIDVCKKVIRIYQEIAQSWILNHRSWEYLLAVLLHLTLELLRGDPPENRDATLGGNLASTMLKTLFVCFLRASMVTKVSPKLWDSLLAVLSSLTQWREVVGQWKLTMETMTQILAQTVYNLDLSDLPLNRLQKEDHPKFRPRVTTTAASDFQVSHPSSFSMIFPAKKSGTPPVSKLVHVGKGADDKVIHGKTKRAPTPVWDTPPTFRQEEASNKDKGLVVPGPIPQRSSSSVGDYASVEGDELKPAAPPHGDFPSPTGSLPSDVMLSVRGGDSEYQRLGEKDISGGDSVIANPHVTSPSPEPQENEGLKPPSPSLREREMDNRELDRKRKKKELNAGAKAKKLPAIDLLVLRNRDYRSPEPESLNAEVKMKPLVAQPPPVGVDVPDGLVLMNESSRDSLLLEMEGKAVAPDSGTHELPQFESDQSREAEEATRILLYKSSSESDLASHRLQHDLEGNNFTEEDDPKLRRVLSSGRTKERSMQSESVSIPVEVDPFSSSIIPSRAGVISPGTQSPVRASPQPKVGKDAKGLDESQWSPSSGGGDLESLRPTGELERGSSPPYIPPSLSPLSLLSPLSPLPPPDWTAVVAAIVWQRMLKILGDINEIKKPSIHNEAMLCLHNIWKQLTDIEANSGISLGNQYTPPLPEFLPPMLLIAPWVFTACSLPPSHLKGRLVAYRLLCEMTIKHSPTPPSPDQLSHFYHLMHSLQPSSTSSDVLHVAVKYGCKLLSYGLAGSSILLSWCVCACTVILTSRSVEAPRTEALCLLGSMLYLPELYSEMVLPEIVEGGGGGGGVLLGFQLKEKLVDILLTAARKEPFRLPRCLALYQIGMLAFSELRLSRPSRRLPEVIDILLASLQFADRGVSMAAVDMVSLLVEVAPQMSLLYPTMPIHVLEAICYAIAVFLTDELDHASWVDKITVTLILCLRDWLMALPIQQMAREGSLSPLVLKTVFEVLQAAAGSPKQPVSKRHALAQLASIRSPVSVSLNPLETTRSPRPHTVRRGGDSTDAHRQSSEVGLHLGEEDRVQVAARSVLTHLLNLLGQFPSGCGAAQMGSVVMEYHDNPSLQHLDELSTEIFDSPRVQFFSFNDSAVITMVEIPTKREGIPGTATYANYQTRLIVRDITGKYTWDSTVLYGPQLPDTQSEYVPSITKAESIDSLVDTLGVVSESTGISDYVPPSSDLLQPPSWKTHINSDRDVLEDLLKHLETTSPECLLYPGKVGLSEPAPAGSEGVERVEGGVVSLLHQHYHAEQQYTREAFTLPSMCGENASAPAYFPSTFAFHHCRLFLSNLGLFSWCKRSHLDLLEKNNQLILELKHLDSIQAQSRQTYKVAVLYVAPGQEDKQSILTNSRGSMEFEVFVSGLGWEVNMKMHAGYMGGLKREFCANHTLPYYATSSEEVLFHVSTRMPSKGTDVEQKVRHLGNDEVHIVWSEHWRDYRRTIFKTQFADVLIVIYPLSNKLFRIQINKKPNVPQFGPLFDGALVDRGSLPSLVRATAINALRAQRSPLVSYRGRYEERLKYIQSVVDKKTKSSYEEFALNVMHPLESSTYPTTMIFRSGTTPQATTSILSSNVPETSGVRSRTSSQGRSSPEKWRLSPKVGKAARHKHAKEHLEIAAGGSPPARRPRASTNDERLMNPSLSGGLSLPRNLSVPENLSELGKVKEEKSTSSSPRKGLSPATSKSSLGAKLPSLFHRTISPSPVPRTHESRRSDTQ